MNALHSYLLYSLPSENFIEVAHQVHDFMAHSVNNLWGYYYCHVSVLSQKTILLSQS